MKRITVIFNQSKKGMRIIEIKKNAINLGENIEGNMLKIDNVTNDSKDPLVRN